jgi:hypothetical protein
VIGTCFKKGDLVRITGIYNRDFNKIVEVVGGSTILPYFLYYSDDPDELGLPDMCYDSQAELFYTI